ncbi:sugar-binding transcriptional regulator [Priestia megaterium]|uniref:sugar-binding transcriptional regulator n=1 Tax=Priestia megaterium TaxID=1404 RepID=UPI0012D9B171|nr:sugar-binding transcriptional regulator [Priestia megaterium]MCT9853450.1 sugar-binding transcriptional regulator [Priestia megaterium]MDF1962944.1 sugar-binding transcriptional regulator [Priestia megaterium]MUL34005.1 Deoxyribonucleoside regulator [Priestia megaterium]
MSFPEDSRLLVKVAHMYYEEGATQSQIANEIGVSRSLVSKYLSKARDLGIVEIIIHDDKIHPYRQLEGKIERLYSLREVVCIPNLGGESSKSRLGAAASKYLLRVLKDGQTVGISGGTTLHEVAMSLTSPQFYPSVTFVPLVGGMGNERMDIHANHIVAQLAESLNANYKLLHAPVMVDSKEAKELFMRQNSILKVFELATQSDIAIVGIGGTPVHSTMVKSYLGEDHKGYFDQGDVVGDICYNFINKKGQAADGSWNEKVITLDLEQLRDIPLVVGVACGMEKVQAIKAALEGRLIQVLITDEETAKALLN